MGFRGGIGVTCRRGELWRGRGGDRTEHKLERAGERNGVPRHSRLSTTYPAPTPLLRGLGSELTPGSSLLGPGGKFNGGHRSMVPCGRVGNLDVDALLAGDLYPSAESEVRALGRLDSKASTWAAVRRVGLRSRRRSQVRAVSVEALSRLQIGPELDRPSTGRQRCGVCSPLHFGDGCRQR